MKSSSCCSIAEPIRTFVTRATMRMPLHFVAERLELPTQSHCLIEHDADPIGDGDMHELEVIGWATCFNPVYLGITPERSRAPSRGGRLPARPRRDATTSAPRSRWMSSTTFARSSPRSREQLERADGRDEPSTPSAASGGGRETSGRVARHASRSRREHRRDGRCRSHAARPGGARRRTRAWRMCCSIMEQAHASGGPRARSRCRSGCSRKIPAQLRPGGVGRHSSFARPSSRRYAMLETLLATAPT